MNEHSPITRQLVERALAIEYAQLPSDVQEIAELCVLDWIGVTLAGSSESLPRLLIDEAIADGGRPLSTVVGHSERVAPLQAALINGSASHVLDYDDGNPTVILHGSASILPGLLALAEIEDINGAEFLAAFVAGYETGCRVALLIQPGHYARGYHNTATIGTLAAATACAHLLKLDPERTAHAVGIAATEAGGLKSMFGTQCKPFHAGLASHNGLRAARLSASGMTARPDVLECPQGFASTMSCDFNPIAALAHPEQFHMRHNVFKHHASCGGTHAAIECVRELYESTVFDVRNIEHVTVRVEQTMDAMCNIAVPKTGLEAKFSLRFVTAAALLRADTGGIALYDDEHARDATLCALRDKMTVELIADWPKMRAEVIVALSDGRTLRATHDAGLPPKDYLREGEQLRAKFERLAVPVVGAARAAAIIELVAKLKRTSAAALMASCSGFPKYR
jgi:2-methylcitrate dehydratase PrpD